MAALTAYTDNEFALFTLGGRRIIVRGSKINLEIDKDITNRLLSQNWRWSAHTHTETTDQVLMASGLPGDRKVLTLFSQERSLILNSTGRRSVFDLYNDYLITEQSTFSHSP